jgi:hypothetical protein
VKNSLLVIFLLLLITALDSKAQENNPYTRFGVGDILDNSSAELNAWGDMSAAYQDEAGFNIVNPASLASMRLTTFQAGAYGRVVQLKDASGTNYFGFSAPAYLTFGMPLKKNWGLSFGLLPYSRVNYNIYQDNSPGNGLPSSVNEFVGSGSLYQVYLATGWGVKGFSLGVSGSYVFGSLSNSSQQIFNDTLNGFNTNYQQERTVGSFAWNAGLQYDLVLGKRDEKTHRRNGSYHVLFGVCGHTTLNLNAKQSYLYDRFYYNSADGTETPYDTTSSVFNQKGKIVIPAVINAGIIIKHRDKWKVGVNYTYNAFQQYRSFGNPDSTSNSYRVSIGGEYIPNFTSEEGYYNHIKYRLGAYYGNYYLQFNNVPLLNYGITFGAGLPLKRIFSDVDVAFDMGVLGTMDNDLVREMYVKTTIGIKFTDKWFLKRKYD